MLLADGHEFITFNEFYEKCNHVKI
jgi:hypothetical protein